MAKFNKNSDFDVDLEYGHKREKEIARIIEKGKLEVKSERDWWWHTNNIAIEFESWGKPSGIKTTKAKYWVHNLCKDEVMYARIIFDVPIVKRLCKKYKNNWRSGGDHKASKFYLIPLKELLIYDNKIANKN
jgi:hypothetical protein